MLDPSSKAKAKFWKGDDKATNIRLMLLLTPLIPFPVMLRTFLPIHQLFLMILLPIFKRKVILSWQLMVLIPWLFSVSLLVSWQTLLTYHKRIKKKNFSAFKIALVASIVYNFWVIDSSVTDHIANNMTSLYNFEKLSLQHVCLLQMKNMFLSKVKGRLN